MSGLTTTLWSAATWRRFHPRRLDAAVVKLSLVKHGCDRSQPAKAVTGHRTPKRSALISVVVFCFVVFAPAQVRADLSASQARKALTRMTGVELKSSAVRVKSVSNSDASSANVTADIQTVFKFQADKDGHWHINEVRTAPDSWEEVELIARALNAQVDRGVCNASDPPFKNKSTTAPSVKRARCLIGNLLGIDIPSDAVRVQEVNTSPFPLASEPSVAVVAWVRVEAQLQKDKSGWRAVQLRTGNRDWVRIDELASLLNQRKQERARAEMALVAAALEKYRKERGSYVISDSHRQAIDFLSPRYLGRVIRVDPWNQPYKYVGDRDHFTIRSSGQDRKADTPDDIELSSPSK